MVYKRYNKGITLIALVVTIVVLLILAGTTYTLVIGNDGIFNNAKNATEKYDNSVANEQEGLNYMANLIDQYVF